MKLKWALIRIQATHNSSGNTWPQSSQLAELLWTDPSLKSGISVHQLISTLKKKAQAGKEWSNLPEKNSHKRGKGHHHQSLNFQFNIPQLVSCLASVQFCKELHWFVCRPVWWRSCWMSHWFFSCEQSTFIPFALFMHGKCLDSEVKYEEFRKRFNS